MMLAHDVSGTSVLARPASVRRACYVASQGVPLFVWLHEPAQPPARKHGVVMCAPAGHEQVQSHRSWRHLAEALADAGFAVVRFDYAGAGDSADPGQPADLETWLSNIRNVLAWLRAQTGCDQVSLIGLRLGGSLAAQIASEQAVENLVLWEPVVRGRTYARELKALAMTADGASATGDVDAAGFLYGKAFMEGVARLDVATMQPRCRRSLILMRDDFRGDAKLAQHFTTLGIETEAASLEKYTEMMAEPHFTQVPENAIAHTVRWLEVAASVSSQDGQARDVPHADARTESPVITEIELEAARERIVHLSDSPKLVGILTEPTSAQNLPLLILPNAGSAYRVGPGRLHVLLARRLAREGFRTLRFDLAGLGDSPGDDPARENDCYAATAFRDIGLALRHGQRTLGADRVILMGLCSGAYFAFQAAAQLASPALVESILINPLTFFWQDGMSLETSGPESPVRQRLAFHYYKTAARQPSKWFRLMTGQTKVGILGALKMVAQRIGIYRTPPAAETTADSGPQAWPTHPSRDDLAADLERVDKLGRQLACFFSRSDPGHDLLMSLAGRKARHMLATGKLTVHFIDHADHTFSRQGPRQALLDAVAAYLRKRR